MKIKLNETDIRAIKKMFDFVSNIKIGNQMLTQSSLYFTKEERKSLRKIRVTINDARVKTEK